MGDSHFFPPIRRALEEQFDVRDTHAYRALTPLLRDENRLFRYKIDRLLRWCDVLVVEWADWKLALATSSRIRRPILARLHSYELGAHLLEVDWNRVAGISFVSETMRRRFLQRIRAYSGKTRVIPNPLDLGRFPFRPKVYGKRLGVLGTLDPIKRHYDLLTSFIDLLQNDGAYTLNLSGPAPSGDPRYVWSLREAISRFGLEGNVTLSEGWQDALEWYGKVDIVVSHSYWEGLPQVVNEAQSTGCYVLCHRWGGAEEVLPSAQLYASPNQLRACIVNWSEATDQIRLDTLRKQRLRVEEVLGDRQPERSFCDFVRDTAR